MAQDFFHQQYVTSVRQWQLKMSLYQQASKPKLAKVNLSTVLVKESRELNVVDWMFQHTELEHGN